MPGGNHHQGGIRMFFTENLKEQTGSSGKQKKAEIVKMIQELSGSHNPYKIFSDWIAMYAIAIQNSCRIKNGLWQEREKRYLELIGQYEKEERFQIAELCGRLVEVMQETEITDWLGEIYMESGCGNKFTGQFFTPFHLSKLTAEMELSGYTGKEKLHLQEPSCGGGGMILAVAAVLKEKGINYQKCLDVVAQDLDWNGVYMTYIQLSLLGIPAVVVQGDTLTDPYRKGYEERRIFRTPAKMGILI